MARRHIFIGYSHEDKPLLEEFLVHLKPWIKEGQLLLWTDKNIEAGQDWDLKIQQAIDRTAVAVLLISFDFLESDYIRQRELPPLIHAREHKNIELTCLYLKPSMVADPDHTYNLTKYQGLNQPGEVVTKHPKGSYERDALLVNAATKLKRLFNKRTDPGISSSVGDERYPLTICLSFRNHQLIRRCFDQHGVIAEYRSPWQMRYGQPEEGKALYEALFGPPGKDKTAEVLREVFPSTSSADPTPIRRPVRVRIQTDDSTLAELPWFRASWEEYPLTDKGWTFELSPMDSQEIAPQLTELAPLQAPCSVLMITPRPSECAYLESDSHRRAFEERLDHAWPVYRERLHIATRWEQLRQVFDYCKPRIIYYYGAAEGDGENLLLLMEDAKGNTQKLPVTSLAELWGNAPPQLIFFNLISNDPVITGISVSPLALQVPLVVTQTGIATDPFNAQSTALEWFHELLEGGQGVEPVRALHRQGLPTAAAWANYGQWRIDTAVESAREQLAKLLLDRSLQRGQVHKAVSELVEDSNLRVRCILAYGAEGNLIELFPDQLAEYLRRHAKGVARIRRVRLRLPADAGTFNMRQIEDQMRKDLGLPPLKLASDKSLREALAKKKPPSLGRVGSLLLLDWGVYGAVEETRINSEELEAWVEFCFERLCAECPEDLRLLSCLMLQRPQEDHDAIEEAVEALHNEHRFRSRKFRLERLHPLDHVNVGELSDFLYGGYIYYPVEDEELKDLPELIYQSTGGRFEQTVQQIEKAQRIGWLALHDKLRESVKTQATVRDKRRKL